MNTVHNATLQKAVRAAKKKIRILGDKALRQNLEMFCGDDVCEAYRLGAEEAQGEIVQRIAELAGKGERAGALLNPAATGS